MAEEAEEQTQQPEEQQQQPQQPAAQVLPYPGKYEDVNKESKSCLAMNELFDGFRIEYNRGVNDQFSVSHNFGLGSTQEPPSYNFGASFMAKGSGNQYGLPAAIMWARMNTDAQMNGRLQFWPLGIPQFMVMMGIQATPEPHQTTAHAEVDWQGDDYHIQGKYLSPSNYGVSYLQSITRTAALGCDLFYNHKQGLAIATVGGRWAKNNNIFSTIITYGHLSTSYTRKASDKVTLSTELTFQQGQQGLESTWTVGAEFNFRASTWKTMLNSQGKVCAYFEEGINPYTRFSLSTELDHSKKQYKFGMGFALNV